MLLCSVIPRFWVQAPSPCTHVSIQIYIVDHGYHTSLIIPTTSPVHDWQYMYFSDAVKYLEFAWGEQQYYTKEDPTWWDTVHALFWPTSSVVHVVGFNSNPRKYFGTLKVKPLTICPKSLEACLQFIRSSFEQEQKQFQYLAKGLYGRSAFFNSSWSYHLFYTCNNWTATALQKAGYQTAIWNGFTFSILLHLPNT